MRPDLHLRGLARGRGAHVAAALVLGASTVAAAVVGFVPRDATQALDLSPSATSDPVVAAAGDIACDPRNSNFKAGLGSTSSCHQKAVSDLLVGTGLTAVLDLGDNQYYCGGYDAFLQSYDKSWGRVKDITSPRSATTSTSPRPPATARAATPRTPGPRATTATSGRQPATPRRATTATTWAPGTRSC